VIYHPAGGAPQGSASPPSGAYTPAQITQAYGINNAVIGDGTGETIAIIDAYDDPKLVNRSSTLPISQDTSFLSSDLHMFDLQYNLPEPAGFFTKVNQSGGSTYPGTDPAGAGNPNGNWEGEEALDVEWAHAIAPGAKIMLVEANDASSNLDIAAGWAASSSGAQVVSMSWSGSESPGETNSDRTTYKSPSSHGVTFLSASGDNGATGSQGDGTGYPGYSPNVISVGGTTLTLSGGNYSSEQGWSFSGGGISAYEAKPAYQSKVTQSSTNRTNPDVSFNADPNTGVIVYDSYSGAVTGGPWYQVGGTSASTPSWAGLIAIADQRRAGQGLGSLDTPTQTLPILYALASADFHDITSGNNGLYSAVKGYDLVTGIGTPVANLLVPDLAGLWVSATTPANSTTVTAPPTSFTITFSAGVAPASLQASALKVNGIAASSLTLNSSDTVATFMYASSPVTTQGTQSLTLAAGSATELDDSSISSLAYSGTFTYQPPTLTVTSTTPATGSTITLPTSSVVLDLKFNQAIDPALVNINNLTLSQGQVTAASVLSGNQTAAYTITGLTAEGTLTVTLPAGTLKDQTDSTGVTAFTGNYFLDNGTMALGTPGLVPPYGALSYGNVASSVLLYGGDVDHFTVSADPGETLTILAVPGSSSALNLAVQLGDPSGTVLGNAAAAGAGQFALLQTVSTTTSGTYTISISGQGNTTGPYSIQVYLDTSLDAANEGIGSDSTPATAQSLAFLPLHTSLASASHADIIGGVTSAATPRYYSLSLAAGEMLTAGLKNLAGGGDNITILDNSSNVLATGAPGPANLDDVISNFVAPSAGTYYLEASGSSPATYNLVVVRDAAFDTENNTSLPAAENLTGATGVLGYVAATAPPPNATDWYQVTLGGTQNALAVATQTPLTGPAQIVNTLKPTIQLFSASDQLVASGVLQSDGRNQSLLATGLTPGATYYIEVSPASSTRGEYFLGVTPLQSATITTNPTSQTVQDGQPLTFTAAASGSPTPTVQWQVSTNSGASYTPIAGATSTSYTIPAASTSQNGNLYEAVFTNVAGSATTTAANLMVTAAAANHLVISVSPNPATAGDTVTITVTAEDPFGNTATSYSGTVHFSSTDGAAMLPANSTLNLGVGTFSVTFHTAGNQTISAVDTGNTNLNGTSGTIVVDPAITVQPSSLPAGLQGSAYSQTVTASGGSGSGFSFSESGNLPAGLTLSSTGVLSGTPTSFGSFPITVTATDSKGGTGSQAYTLTIASNLHLVLSTPSGATAGNGFAFTVQVEDSANNPASGFSGTVSFSTTDPQGKVPAPATMTGSFGVFLATLYKVAGGPWTITATAGAMTVTSAPITVTPGPATRLGFVTQPVSTPTGDALPPVTVQVLDAYGNTITGDNTDTITLGIASGPGTFTSASTTSATVQNGLATFNNLTLTVLGTYTLSAVVPARYTGPNSTAFTVLPLQVVPGSFAGTPSGFSLQFNAPFLANSLTPVLYGQGFGASAPAPSVIVTTDPGNLADTAAYVQGSLVLSPATNTITWVETDTASLVNNGTPLLPDGTYTVIVRATAVDSGFQALNPGGGFLDGLGTCVGGSGDFTATFQVQAAALKQNIVWVPDVAAGPGQMLVAPGAGQAGNGFPIYLDSATAVVNNVQVTLNYDPTLITITGVSGAHFSLQSSSTPGHAVLRFSGATLPAGTKTIIGYVLAQVPSGTASNPTPYKAKDLLHLTHLSLNNGVLRAATGDGLHLVAYVGDGDGNGSYSSSDAVLITRVALQRDSGFAAYPLTDPVIVADTDGSGFIPADAALQISEASVNVPTTNLPSPPIPSGVVFQAVRNNVDPTLSISSLAESDGTVSASINIDNAHPPGSTGLIQADLALTYNSQAFTVSAADVHLGSLLAGSPGWTLAVSINTATGQIAITLTGATPIQTTAAGSLVTIDVHPLGTQPASPALALVPWVDPTGTQVIRTELQDAQGTFTLDLSGVQ
jgi:hypothetical protein